MALMGVFRVTPSRPFELACPSSELLHYNSTMCFI